MSRDWCGKQLSNANARGSKSRTRTQSLTCTPYPINKQVSKVTYVGLLSRKTFLPSLQSVVSSRTPRRKIL